MLYEIYLIDIYQCSDDWPLLDIIEAEDVESAMTEASHLFSCAPSELYLWPCTSSRKNEEAGRLPHLTAEPTPEYPPRSR